MEVTVPLNSIGLLPKMGSLNKYSTCLTRKGTYCTKLAYLLYVLVMLGTCEAHYLGGSSRWIPDFRPKTTGWSQVAIRSK